MLSENNPLMTMTIEEMKEKGQLYYRKDGKVDGRCIAKREKLVDENGNDLRVLCKSNEDEQQKQKEEDKTTKLYLFQTEFVCDEGVWNNEYSEDFLSSIDDIIEREEGFAWEVSFVTHLDPNDDYDAVIDDAIKRFPNFKAWHKEYYSRVEDEYENHDVWDGNGDKGDAEDVCNIWTANLKGVGDDTEWCPDI